MVVHLPVNQAGQILTWHTMEIFWKSKGMKIFFFLIFFKSIVNLLIKLINAPFALE